MTERQGEPNTLTRTLAIPIIIAVVCTAFELVFLMSDAGLFGDGRLRMTAIENLGFWPGLLDDWRQNYPGQKVLMFATYGFLHAGPLHLILNMLTLLSLSVLVIGRVGPVKYSVLYVACLLGGAVGFWLVADTFSPMIGASGALFGLAGAIVSWDYVDRFTLRAGLWPVLRVILFLLLLNVAMWWAMDGRLAWQTHLGGFLAGWVFALLLDPRGPDHNERETAE